MTRSSSQEINLNNTFFSAIDCQRQLIFAGLEDFSANAALPNFHGGQYGGHQAEWRKAVVEFICSNIDCGLLEVFDYPGKSKSLDRIEVMRLLKNGDESRGLDAELIWNCLYFSGTEKLKGVLEKLGILSWEAINGGENVTLMEYLKEAYQTPKL